MGILGLARQRPVARCDACGVWPVVCVSGGRVEVGAGNLRPSGHLWK
eukprot:COSAG02_NODE_111_length_36009_cov_42.221248_24_plen_47_part_00